MLKNSCVMHHRTGPAPGIMVWDSIGYQSRTPLVRIADYTPQLPHQINFGNVWKLLGLLYPKNTSKVSLNQCRGVGQRLSPIMAVTLTTDSSRNHRSL
ncbi:transposable element Tcb1 transposase [Trichonephila clavipes]|nr:transposable element Tcb1 transposase [Trichonephila clavipes]